MCITSEADLQNVIRKTCEKKVLLLRTENDLKGSVGRGCRKRCDR